MLTRKYNFEKDALFVITGGAGFIGSNLSEALVNMGYRVRVLDDLSNGNIHNLHSIANNPLFEFIKGDIRNYDTCLKITKDATYVLHQAAWGSVPRSIEMPQLYEEINIKGTLNMLEASRVNKVKRFVYASSSSVYGDEPNLPKYEGREGKLLSPYALTKRVNEEYARLYWELYQLPTIGLRYFNVFGRKQNPDGQYAAVVPKFIKTLMKGQKPIIYGDGQQSRDFTYIENVIEANLKSCLANQDAFGKAFNIAFGSRITLIEMYNIISQKLNKTIEPFFTQERRGDIRHSLADISAAKQLLKYDPQYDFLKGITESIDWYLNNL
ncbi:SDR family oxidoreductase [Acholeplasma equirhinis]|uniref:SDR family oxidoreductase n=1 Tax=Acholeplasma equirhinis TaxID=555393 RepID=UPI00197ACBF5|nr:SDR family oxidoreductase [Acholeplasma equirhinis]